MACTAVHTMRALAMLIAALLSGCSGDLGGAGDWGARWQPGDPDPAADSDGGADPGSDDEENPTLDPDPAPGDAEPEPQPEPEPDPGPDGEGDGVIPEGCVPDCAGRVCGDDGCGGSCGDCGEDACTSGGLCVSRPAGGAARRFDVATSNCPEGRWELGCPEDDPDLERCFCKPEFDGLNYGTAHFLATSTDRRRGDIWEAGNFQSVYVNDLNEGWRDGGAARADAVMARTEEGFPSGVPAWFIVNEISAGLWPDDADYRRFVVAFARTMTETYGKHVVIASPFATPGRHADDWSDLAGWAWIGAEVYLSGQEVNGSGNSVDWCTNQYEASIDAYEGLGVSLNRLMLFEHFGNSLRDIEWGRAGVSFDGWNNAIEARAEAAASLGFAGFISYSWAGNQMHETGENRRAFMDTYAAQALP